MPPIEHVIGQFPEGEVERVARLAAAAAGPQLVEVEELNAWAVREQHGESTTVRLIDAEPWQKSPTRKRGLVALHEAASFVEYVNEQKDTDSRLYASLEHSLVVAVLNDDPKGERTTDGAWRDHRATLRLQKTPEWKRWRARDAEMGDQVEFAEHLEECLADIVAPVAADLLEIARSFTASSEIKFRSAHKLASGETQIAYDEEITATAGAKKNVAIPDTFTLRLAPYHGIDPIDITARLRYRLRDGRLAIGYVLDKPDDVELEAFRAVVDVVAEGTGIKPLMGVAAGERSRS